MRFNYFPMGTQLYSKKPELYSEYFPYDYDEAKGIQILSNNKSYLDFSTMGIGSCILGYSNQIVNKKVIDSIENGNMSSLNPKQEILLAEKLNKYEPHKMYRYLRTGGEAMAAAVRMLRTYTGNDIILTNGYNGWHDWWLAGNINSNIPNHIGVSTREGVPQKLNGTCYYFNDKDSFKKILSNLNEFGNIAGVVLELARYKEIDKELLDVIINSGLLLIVDEITTGWRSNLGGYYNRLGIDPDMVVYGKAISNGYPFSVVCGKENIMEKSKDTFISSTYWSEAIGTTAALATIEELEKYNYSKRYEIELRLRIALGKKFNEIDGFAGMIHYKPKNRARWIDFMLEKGYLVTDQIYLSFSHTEDDINKFIEVMNEYQE